MNEWWSAFHFLRPQWLWLLLAAPVIYLSFYIQNDTRARWKRYIDPELLPHLIVARHRRLRFRPIHMVTLLLLIGTIAISGPTWRREQPPFSEDKAPLIIVLDLSETMDTIDLDPTRLERAKLKLRDLLKVRNGGRTALFVYAGSTHMVLPFTTDFSLFDLYLSSLSTSLMPREGKDTSKALAVIQDFLKDEPVPGTILFVTDGIEPRAFFAFQQFTSQQDNQNEILVMGVGTSNGGPIRIADNRFLIDGAGRRIYSKLDIDQLRSLNHLHIAATTLTLNQDDIEWIQRRVQHHLNMIQQQNSKMQWIDEGYWFTIPIAAIALLWFRKGWTVRWSTAIFACFFFLPTGNAQSHFSWIDLWLTHDQQGRYYYEHGDYKTAAERFDIPLWKGLSLVHVGDYEAAYNAFALTDSAEGWYNQGDALAHLGKYSEAVQAYQQALARRHPWPEAQDNLALMQALIAEALKKKKNDVEHEIAPGDLPDKMQFDEKGKQGKQTIKLNMDPKKMAEIWMRNIQTTPADFLRRRFAMQAAKERRP